MNDIPESFCNFTEAVQQVPGLGVTDFLELSDKYGTQYSRIVAHCREWADATLRTEHPGHFGTVLTAVLVYCEELKIEIVGADIDSIDYFPLTPRCRKCKLPLSDHMAGNDDVLICPTKGDES